VSEARCTSRASGGLSGSARAADLDPTQAPTPAEPALGGLVAVRSRRSAAGSRGADLGGLAEAVEKPTEKRDRQWSTCFRDARARQPRSAVHGCANSKKSRSIKEMYVSRGPPLRTYYLLRWAALRLVEWARASGIVAGAIDLDDSSGRLAFRAAPVAGLA
jgi:hypothetical protein